MMLCTQLGWMMYFSLRKLSGSDSQNQMQMGILQLRSRCARALECSVEEETLVINDGHNQFEISFHNNRIVKRPGYEIFVENVEDASFRAEAQCIVLDLTTEGKTDSWQICCQ